MDIRDVSAEISRASQKDRPDPSRRGSASAKAHKTTGDRDHFENSGQLGQVRALIDLLAQTPEISQEAVERGKQLLASGELDSPAGAAKAAEGFLAEGGGFFG
ncbi:MAG: hypothetical protein ACI97A_000038 [Planctomycetota bacterium]|jgi:hypothetical protein